MTDQACIDALAEALDAGRWRDAWLLALHAGDCCDGVGVLRRDLVVANLLRAVSSLAASLHEAGVTLPGDEPVPESLREMVSDALAQRSEVERLVSSGQLPEPTEADVERFRAQLVAKLGGPACALGIKLGAGDR